MALGSMAFGVSCGAFGPSARRRVALVYCCSVESGWLLLAMSRDSSPYCDRKSRALSGASR
jgi:hypothetical protein